jgi:protease I
MSSESLKSLHGQSLAVLAYPGYQELEFWYPVFRAREEGATVAIIASSEPCESFLGYPVLGDTEPSALDVPGLAALIVPGTVEGLPAASEAQRDLIRAVHASGGKVFASGSGVALVKEAVGEEPAAGRSVPGPDELPALVRSLLAALSS